MAKKHTLPVKAAIEAIGGTFTTERIGVATMALLAHYEGAKETLPVRDKLVEDLSAFTHYIRDELRHRHDAALPDPVLRKARPAMYGMHDIK